jgi:hypothetical protein
VEEEEVALSSQGQVEKFWVVNLVIKADNAPENGTQLWTVTFGTHGRSRVFLVVQNIAI